MPDSILAEMLADALLAGDPDPLRAADRAAHVVGKGARWIGQLAQRFTETFAGKTRPRRNEVAWFVWQDEGFRRHARRLRIHHWLTEPNQMQPVAAAASWDLPRIESIGALAEWLGISFDELVWFADLKDLNRRHPSPRVSHYHYRTLIKRNGTPRVIESPKPRLKQMQRQILTQILNRIPPHRAVHGFVRGRSVRSFAAPHSGQRVVLRMDLADFFPSFRGARVQTMFRTIGYPEPVADLLGGLCSNAAPASTFQALLLYGFPHLPQGAPTSPALANVCFYRIDCRLTGLAAASGAMYTRYADDLAFSGDETFDRRVERFTTHVAVLLQEEGYTVNHHKTRIMRRSVRQRLAGLVTNERLNIPREEFDRLKAILTNCVRRGAAGENREGVADFRAHLQGRVAWVESVNPSKGARLRALFDRITW
jgi:RNA-directed DNA polymerase